MSNYGQARAIRNKEGCYADKEQEMTTDTITRLIQAAEQARDDLTSVLCNPEGTVCINGSDGDRKVAQAALTELTTAIEAAKQEREDEPVIDPNCTCDPYGACAYCWNGKKHDTTPQPQVPEGWQPIETAPKDGTLILLCRVHPNSEVRIAVSDGQWLETRNGHWDWVWPYIRKEPTHWMPLPAAPKPEGK